MSKLFLFDVHGTLALNKQMAQPEIFEMLEKIKNIKNKSGERDAYIAFVSGANLEAIKKQLGENVLEIFDYSFTENGVQYYINDVHKGNKSLIDHIGDDRYNKLIKILFNALNRVDCPIRRSNFIDLRTSLVNLSPIGRNCTVKERNEFDKIDKQLKIRENIVSLIKNDLNDLELDCTISGQISIDIFPHGWDKSYCLNHLKYETIYFFGDMTEKGQNDHKLFVHSRTIGHKVTDPTDTINQVYKIINNLKY